MTRSTVRTTAPAAVGVLIGTLLLSAAPAQADEVRPPSTPRQVLTSQHTDTCKATGIRAGMMATITDLPRSDKERTQISVAYSQNMLHTYEGARVTVRAPNGSVLVSRTYKARPVVLELDVKSGTTISVTPTLRYKVGVGIPFVSSSCTMAVGGRQTNSSGKPVIENLTPRRTVNPFDLIMVVPIPR